MPSLVLEPIMPLGLAALALGVVWGVSVAACAVIVCVFVALSENDDAYEEPEVDD